MGPEQVEQMGSRVLALLERHSVSGRLDTPLDGAFSLGPGAREPDLYGMIDAAYLLYSLGKLEEYTTRASRKVWANRLLMCQDETGWFSRRNLRGHRHEHATAYAVGALRLLAVEEDETYLESVRPFEEIRPLLRDEELFRQWIDRMGFHGLTDIPRKNVGWHHVWRGSHIGGGVAAAVGMMGEIAGSWWGESVDLNGWFEGYFKWLDERVNPATGFWQRAFWNRVYRRPTLIDLGGATHFLWVYCARDHPIQFPERVIESTVALQKRSGLYRDYPYCIDLDANYCVIRSFLQLDPGSRTKMQGVVQESVMRNFEAVARTFLTEDLSGIYTDLHGPPGALAALVECTKLPSFPHAEALQSWRHPLDEAWWL